MTNKQPPQWRRVLNQLLGWLWQTPLALLILFEEWGWEPLQRALAALARWPGFRQLEAWILRLPPYGSLALLVLPSLLLLPVKLLALWAIAKGHSVLGALVILGAKLGGTALVARLFSLTQPKLMQIGWFARLYARWLPWKESLLARVRASAPWHWASAFKQSLRARFSLWWQRFKQSWLALWQSWRRRK